MIAPSRELTHRQEALKLTLKQVTMPWAIYIRVSTKDQGEKYSPASQREALLRFAGELGVTVPERFILIDMKSGKTEDRPDYQMVMKLAADKAIGGVLALCLDRVGRNVVDAIQFRKLLKREGAALAFAMQTFDDSPQGTLMYTQFAAIAEYEAALIQQRTSKGRLQKALEGKPLTDPHTFGYRYHPTVRLKGGKIQDGYVEPHPVEAPILLHQIFEAYAEHGSSYRIAEDLNAAGILTKRGNPWTLQRVLRVLRHRKYTGDYVIHIKGEDLRPVAVTVKNPALALIPQALFDKVQVMLSKNRDRAGRPPTENLLSGFLRCACTLPVSGTRCTRKWTMNNKWCFACTNKYNRRRPVEDRCPSREVSRVVMERKVVDEVRNSLRAPENTYRMAKAFHLASTRSAPKADTSIETKLKRLQSNYERTEAVLFAEVPQQTRDKAARRLRELDEERRALEVDARETAAVNVVALPAEAQVASTFQRIQKGLDGLETFAEKREFLSSTVRHIETDGHTYTIFCRVRLDPASAGTGRKNSALHCEPAQYFDYLIHGRVA